MSLWMGSALSYFLLTWTSGKCRCPTDLDMPGTGGCFRRAFGPRIANAGPFPMLLGQCVRGNQNQFNVPMDALARRSPQDSVRHVVPRPGWAHTHTHGRQYRTFAAVARGLRRCGVLEDPGHFAERIRECMSAKARGIFEVDKLEGALPWRAFFARLLPHFCVKGLTQTKMPPSKVSRLAMSSNLCAGSLCTRTFAFTILSAVCRNPLGTWCSWSSST